MNRTDGARERCPSFHYYTQDRLISAYMDFFGLEIELGKDAGSSAWIEIDKRQWWTIRRNTHFHINSVGTKYLRQPGSRTNRPRHRGLFYFPIIKNPAEAGSAQLKIRLRWEDKICRWYSSNLDARFRSSAKCLNVRKPPEVPPHARGNGSGGCALIWCRFVQSGSALTRKPPETSHDCTIRGRTVPRPLALLASQGDSGRESGSLDPMCRKSYKKNPNCRVRHASVRSA